MHIVSFLFLLSVCLGITAVSAEDVFAVPNLTGLLSDPTFGSTVLTGVSDDDFGVTDLDGLLSDPTFGSTDLTGLLSDPAFG
jgi:hypothetical protein